MTGQSETPAASGIYALIHLDGSPVAAADAQRLGLVFTPGPILAAARDTAQPLALNQRVTADEVALFAGFLDEGPDLAASLGLSRSADPLSIAIAAWQRHGADMPYHALGEWSLLLWRAGHGVNLLSSMPRRDRLCFARVGHRLAVAPGIWTLSRLPWVGADIDEIGFQFGLMPFHVRQEAACATALTHVRQLPPGGSAHISLSGEKIARSRSWRSFAAPCFTGSQRDAMAETEALLRQSMRQRVARSVGPGALLSGGLDSSLLTWLLSETCGRDAPFPCFTSAAPDDSGLAHEVDKARIVADKLGLPIHPVLPPSDWSPYRPSISQFTLGNGAVLSNRHYLYQRFADDADRLGVHMLFDGLYGEQTVTTRYPLDTLGLRLRKHLRQLTGRSSSSDQRRAEPLVRFAPHRLATMPAAIREAQKDLNEPRFRLPRRGERWLFAPGDAMRLGAPSEISQGGVRSELPFRDIRLWRLFAGFPTEFALHNGLDRAPVRMILKGHLPDSIRMQPKGLGFSPDYFQRLRRHALTQADRIILMRQSGVDDWFDLDWLDTNLRRIGATGATGAMDALRVQATAMNAEMLMWWRSGMPVET